MESKTDFLQNIVDSTKPGHAFKVDSLMFGKNKPFPASYAFVNAMRKEMGVEVAYVGSQNGNRMFVMEPKVIRSFDAN